MLLLPFLLALGMSYIYLQPARTEMAESPLTMTQPLYEELDGWYGVKRQESELERKILAADTRFSKADYFNMKLGSRAKLFGCHVSIVLSGNDMNSSIHRPELCLPSQGHFNLTSSTKSLTLDNGRKVRLTKLNSQTNISQDPKKPQLLNSVNYYIFVGHHYITHNHIMRVARDSKIRIVEGRDQRWAYIQAGVSYGNLIGTSREEAEEQVELLIKSLLPRIIKWEEIGR